MRYHLTLVRMAIIRNPGKHVEKSEPSCTVGGNVNWYCHHGEEYRGAFKKKNRATI